MKNPLDLHFAYFNFHVITTSFFGVFQICYCFTEFILISSTILWCPLKCCDYVDTETVLHCLNKMFLKTEKLDQKYLQTPIKRHLSTNENAHSYSLISIIL